MASCGALSSLAGSTIVTGLIRAFDIRELGAAQRLCASGRMLAFELAAVDGLQPMREIIRAYVSGNGDAASALVLHEDVNHGPLTALSVMRIFQHAQNGDERVGLATLEFIAPAPDTSARFEAWTALAESQSLIAAGRGARHTLAEAPEGSQEFDALLAAGFTPWMHQDALKMAGAPASAAPEDAPWLHEMSGDADEASARWLSARVVPKPLQRSGAQHDLIRLAHRPAVSYLAASEGETQGWIAVYAGRRAFSIRSLFRTEAEVLVRPSIEFVIARLRRRAQRPIYCVVPSFASWQLPALDAAGFAHVTSNLLMIRTNLATVRQPVWSVEFATAQQKAAARHNVDTPNRYATTHDQFSQ